MASYSKKQNRSFPLRRNVSHDTAGGDSLRFPEDEVHFSGHLDSGQIELIKRLYFFYKSIIQNINAGLLALDFHGRIIFANRRAGTLLGISPRDLLRRTFQEFLETEAQGAQVAGWFRVPGKGVDNVEVHLRRADGKKFIAGLSISPLEDARNQFSGVVLLIHDLTETYRLRRQVERMERLALLGELAAGIAHEIRNPMAGIKASAQILLEELPDDDYRRQLMTRIIREVDKSNGLLTEFFKFARPTRPKPNFHDIELIIDSVYLLLAPRLRNRNIRFKKQFEENLPRVYVDEHQIEQVILNLFLNAMDAMVEGGTLTVRTRKRELSLVEQKQAGVKLTGEKLGYILVEVQDTGPGIPEKLLERIFNPFFTTKPEGLGLGLSICTRLVEENRGKLDVVSKLGEGTTFIVALPTFSRAIPRGMP